MREEGLAREGRSAGNAPRTILALMNALETGYRLAGGCTKRYPSKPGHQVNETQKEKIHESPPPFNVR